MVQVDKDLCIACGLCFSTHPDFFALGADGKAEAIKQTTTDEEMASVQEAIDNCPV
ncbi:MAG: ferredoxin, partial [bacterium]